MLVTRRLLAGQGEAIWDTDALESRMAHNASLWLLRALSGRSLAMNCQSARSELPLCWQ
ncbi:MAG: hypothetical protein K0U36_01970 [Alphaproteobacteria bacterium]|nr:hypothetical protein [Alphaproteobacteria bacterium]